MHTTTSTTPTSDLTIVGHVQNGFLGRMARYKPYTVVVWLALAKRANTEGTCWPSITRIQKDTGLGRPTVYRAIRELVEAGEVVVDPGGGKGNQTNLYRLTGSSQGELVHDGNQFPTDTKVVPHRDKGSSQGEHKPDKGTKHKNHTGRAGRNGYTEAFETFWSVVAPHKRKSKAEAFKRYRETVVALADKHADATAFLLDRATAYYASPLGKTCFAHGPAPWLYQGGYDDDPAAWQRGEDNGKPAKVEPVKYRDEALR